LAPVSRMQRGLVSIVSDKDHFACCDLQTRFAWCQVSGAVLEDPAWLRWHFLEAMAYFLLCSEDVVTVHAGCVAKNGRGVLLCGSSGSGKSSMAFACVRAGWTYVSDDAMMLLQCSSTREAVGRPHRFQLRPEAAALFPELAGFPIYVRPNGKPTLEVPADALPWVSTASRCSVASLVFLDRGVDGGADLRPVDPTDAMRRLMREMPDYGGVVRERHERTLRGLVESASAWELLYSDFADALKLLPGCC